MPTTRTFNKIYLIYNLMYYVMQVATSKATNNSFTLVDP